MSSNTFQLHPNSFFFFKVVTIFLLNPPTSIFKIYKTKSHKNEFNYFFTRNLFNVEKIIKKISYYFSSTQ